jgi:hypothetical protein
VSHMVQIALTAKLPPYSDRIAKRFRYVVGGICPLVPVAFYPKVFVCFSNELSIRVAMLCSQIKAVDSAYPTMNDRV